MAEPTVSELFATTYENVINPNKPSDAIFKSGKLLKILKEKGFKSGTSDGGNRFAVGVEYKTNPNDGPMAQAGTIPTTHTDIFTEARYDIAIHAGAVSFYEFEVARCTGKSAKLNLVTSKLKNAEKTHGQNINATLWGDGSAIPLPIGGVQSIISATPTSGIVGGIDRGSQGYWRNVQVSGTRVSTAFDTLRSAMTSAYYQCSLGGDVNAPTAWVTDRTTITGYMSLLVPGERFNKDSGLRGGDAGWDIDGIAFAGAAGYYDEECAVQAAGNLYFVNPEFMQVKFLEGHWMKKGEKKSAVGQLSFVYEYHTFAQLVTSNPRHLGVVTGVN